MVRSCHSIEAAACSKLVRRGREGRPAPSLTLNLGSSNDPNFAQSMPFALLSRNNRKSKPVGRFDAANASPGFDGPPAPAIGATARRPKH